MYLKIINKNLSQFNQSIFKVTDNKTISQKVHSQLNMLGWAKADCQIQQVRDELITTKYRGVDGKTIPPGMRQYKTRAKSYNNLNKKQVPVIKVV